jgi:hypothetical protein
MASGMFVHPNRRGNTVSSNGSEIAAPKISVRIGLRPPRLCLQFDRLADRVMRTRTRLPTWKRKISGKTLKLRRDTTSEKVDPAQRWHSHGLRDLCELCLSASRAFTALDVLVVPPNFLRSHQNVLRTGVVRRSLLAPLLDSPQTINSPSDALAFSCHAARGLHGLCHGPRDSQTPTDMSTSRRKPGMPAEWVAGIDNYWEEFGIFKTMGAEKNMMVRDVLLEMVPNKACGNTLEDGTQQELSTDGFAFSKGNEGGGFTHQVSHNDEEEKRPNTRH